MNEEEYMKRYLDMGDRIELAKAGKSEANPEEGKQS
jgi:hypothetical protein